MWITIEGNIGSGKTTLFESLQEKADCKDWIFAREPVDLWIEPTESLSNKSTLDCF